MQTLQDEGEVCSGATETIKAIGFHQDPDRVGFTWRRLDWQNPVGWFARFTSQPYEVKLPQGVLVTTFFYISELQLTHQAALLLLQGRKLSDVLIPNHEINGNPWAHLVVGAAPWRPYEVPSKMKDLQLVCLHRVPDGVAPQEVLSIVAQHALRLHSLSTGAFL